MKKVRTRIVDMTLSDALYVTADLPTDEQRQIEAFSGQPFDPESAALAAFLASGPRWAMRTIEDDTTLAVGGLIPVGPNRYHTHMFVTQEAWDNYAFDVTLATRAMLDSIFENQEHRRIETYCLAARRTAREWYEKIGLKLESTLPGYGAAGESAVLFTKVMGARNY